MKERKNVLEWAVFAVSLALIALTIGTLAVDSVTHRDGQPELTVTVAAPVARGDDVLLRLYVHNAGGGSAEKVRVRVESDDPAVTGDLEIDFVPRSSTRDGFVVLPRSARGIRARVTGWVAP
jgi:uncharacterized protein (TIGR02588 family)